MLAIMYSTRMPIVIQRNRRGCVLSRISPRHMIDIMITVKTVDR